MPQTAEKVAFLRETVHHQPEYGEILPLFMELYQAIDGREGETGISFETPPLLATHNRLPLITPESIKVDQRRAALFVTGVIDALIPAVKEGREELTLLGSAISLGKIELQSLFAGCLFRDRVAFNEAAEAIGVSAALVEFALEPALKTALEAFAEGIPPSLVEGWEEGYCPVCGSRAGMSELTGEEGKRQLCCSTCFFKWPYKRMKCPYCSNEDAASLSYFKVGDSPTRVDVCRKCSRYLKTRDTRQGHADVPIDAEDLATIHLDLMARKEGFVRGI